MPTARTATPAAGALDTAADFASAPATPVTKPILVATDASATADSAFVMARLLAHRSGAPVEVVTVLEPSMVDVPLPSSQGAPLDTDIPRIEALREQTRHQLGVLVGEASGWLVDTCYGPVAPTIRARASESDADLVIMGVSRHGLVARLFGEETTAQVAQRTAIPLLAASAEVDRLPRRVVVAVSPESPAVPESAAVRTLLGDVEAVHFVTVWPHIADLPPMIPLSDPIYVDGVRDACERVKSSVGLSANVYREPVAIAGTPAKAILDYASEVKADLIVVWQARRWFLGHWTGGGLATRLLRSTTRSVLVLPQPRKRRLHRTDDQGTAPAGKTETITNRDLWTSRLAELSRRNAGRDVTLEIDDAGLGAQTQATNFPFLGIDYDRGDDRIAIMLGNPAGGTAHLTHSIVAPLSLDILEGVDGTTLALRIENEPGQALLVFPT